MLKWFLYPSWEPGRFAEGGCWSPSDSKTSEGIIGCQCDNCKSAREAALKRSVDSRPPRGTDYEHQPCKRLRESPPVSPPARSPPAHSPPTYSSHPVYNSNHTSHSSSYQESSTSSTSQSHTSHTSSSQQHQSAAQHSSYSHNSVSSSQPLPWQPFTHHPQKSPPHPTLPTHLPPPPAYSDSNLPLNLSVSHGHSRQASLPRASSHIAANAAASASSRGEDSSSPGVPESVVGRRVMTYNGLMFYPTPVHGASLPNMEAKTYRDVDSDVCDPAIEEHFRRSLGSAYGPAMCRSSSPRTPSPPSANHVANSRGQADGGHVITAQDTRVKLVSVSGAVDEHFAKSLGQKTWSQLQYQSATDADPSSVDAHFTKALGDTWLRIKAEQDVTSRQHGALHHGNRAGLYHHQVAPPSVQ